MNNILITGSTSFVGKNLAYFLAKQGFRISALDRNEQTNKNIHHSYTWANLDKIDFNVFHTIIHLAGKAHDVKGLTHIAGYSL